MPGDDTVPAGADVLVSGHPNKYSVFVQLRYNCNRDKARARVARVHAKVADCRRDWLHKESTRLIRENQAVKDGPKPLGVRAWTCAACGAVHDRDVNAARNVLALGRRESLNARGGQVRPAPVLAPAREAGSRSGAA
jgi:transposase